MPNTLEENVNRVKAAKTAIANAITAKGGTVEANDGLEDFASDIATIPSGGGGGSASDDVRFIDYDGTIVHSYSKSDFANLTELPANPSHEGLTAQGWNWSLSEAKTYVATNGKLDIGQMYVTSDGKTRLYINLLDAYKSPTLELYLDANSEVDVDWGDGSSHSTLSSTSAGYQSETHSYGVSGDYIIAITVVSGSIEIRGNNNSFSLLKGNDSTTNTNYRESLFNIEIGSSVTSIAENAFNRSYSLASIIIPSTVTSIGVGAFNSCYSLSSITISSGVTSIGSRAFNSCYSLSSITIPSTVTSIGENAFYSCSSLTSIIIPSGVTSIAENAFNSCYSLTSITISSGVTSIGVGAFDSCYSLTSITIPSTVTSIGSRAFDSCYSLSSITISSGVTSIGSRAFNSCYSLSSITIPSTVTSIGNYAFDSCSSLLYINYLGMNLPSGSPWGALNTHVKVRALRRNNYTSAAKEASSGTILTTSVSCTVGDLIVATFENLGGEYTPPSGWTLLGDSGAVVISQWTQRTGMAYKIAESTTESFTLTQASSGRMFTNLIAITGASIGTFSGFTKNETNNTITATKPQGLTIWAVSTLWWGSKWDVSPIYNKTKISNLRCENFLDQSDDTTATFTTDTTQSAGGLACASLTITGIDNFWYYDEP